ncbi:hypothetical protein COCCADRAFT_110667, partial [Bipolaris zeicola 26-R-13]
PAPLAGSNFRDPSWLLILHVYRTHTCTVAGLYVVTSTSPPAHLCVPWRAPVSHASSIYTLLAHALYFRRALADFSYPLFHAHEDA